MLFQTELGRRRKPPLTGALQTDGAAEGAGISAATSADDNTGDCIGIDSQADETWSGTCGLAKPWEAELSSARPPATPLGGRA